MHIRTAQTSDAAALLAIYQPSIENSTTSFEYILPTLAEFETRISQTLENYPYLVMVEDDQILGYAYAHPYAERAAYQWSTEISVYIAKAAQGQGIGRQLYQKIEAILEKQNVVNVCACVTGQNQNSIAFHEHMGYEIVGQFKHIGFKEGQWLDTFWLQKELNCPDVPAPFIPFSKL
ncbi:GNAT family N-acetyltransferase [Fructobacillus durionis]|uniref:Phosphinothricin acetyltransferase n=1 Tax=Fructobacillus durionis TaxID=283737 RepID=A0A1I1EN63_9LACO|nr:GNAT family N-acetyltransferase [Fructobacillus durionis]SFB86938.1 phosphinothricin acetyltransferase [Fructobacillus durionis]